MFNVYYIYRQVYYAYIISHNGNNNNSVFSPSFRVEYGAYIYFMILCNAQYMDVCLLLCLMGVKKIFHIYWISYYTVNEMMGSILLGLCSRTETLNVYIKFHICQYIDCKNVFLEIEQKPASGIRSTRYWAVWKHHLCKRSYNMVTCFCSL